MDNLEMLRWSIVLFGVALRLVWAQEASFPLEEVKISGSQVPAAVVMEMSGLKLGQPLNKAGIEDACQKLGQSGIFEDVSYQYAPGPQKGYVVTLQLTDPRRMVDAAFDLNGVDEKGLWTWIEGQFPKFQHRVPQSDEAQQYLASLVERKLGASLHGEHIVTRMETDLAKHRSLVSFQAEHLPRITEMKFNGANRVPAEELNALMQKLLGDDGYTERHFRVVVEAAMRQAYEQHGMFKVQFPTIQATNTGPMAVGVATTIVEGPQYKLADVQLIGDDLPVEAMLKAAHFKKGEVANWTEIRQGLERLETPIRRGGYLDQATQSERVLEDGNANLLLKVSVRKGPLYHFGQVAFVGLTPELEMKARTIWKMGAGDTFDFLYWTDFVREFGKAADLRAFKGMKATDEAGVGDHVRNQTVVFQGK